MQELEENAYLERLGVEMIELRDCIVGVKDEKEYEKVIQIAEEHMQLAEWLEELKSYKEAEEQGLLVRLPCPVGTTVWDICGMDIRENVVCGIECGKNGKQFLWANHDE